MPDRKIERQLRIAGTLVALGLVFQFFTIFWNHPLGFLLFLGAGVPMTIGGILFYLVSLLTALRDTTPD